MTYSRNLTGLLLSTALLAAGPAAAQKKTPAARPKPAAPGYALQGEVAAPDGTKVYLNRQDDKTSYKDSTTVQGGHFAFRGRLVEPSWVAVQVPAAKRYAGFFLENRPVAVQLPADAKAPAVIKGSATQDEYASYDAQWRAITQKAGPIYEMLAKATPAGAKEATPEARKEADERFAALGTESKQVAEAYVQAHPNSLVAASVIQWRFVDFPDYDEASKLYKQLGPAAKASAPGRSVSKFMTTWDKTAIGTKPEFAQADATGKQVKLSDFRGKYVLVDFWASWCGPCRKENPNVVAMYSKYHGQGFEVVGVSLDAKKEPWLKAIETDGLAWTQLSDLQGWKNAVALQYGIAAVPQNFLVDPQGKVIAKNLRGEELQAKLAQLFAAK
ncbi:redoxin domain-containing protein [Hymenobacter bucti]|uniref:Redoxin domain-containing protein n=1 Tax=Hymenobacter bucti TaxID=1844114 RepID=A0ABW4R0E9_9BACT